MNKDAILVPVRFRFTYEPDAKTYGNPDDPDGWWTYDESVITALPVRQLADLEDALKMRIVEMLQGVRDDSIIGLHAASWVAIHLSNKDIAGPYDAYSPRILWTEWIPTNTPPQAADPLDSAGSPTSSEKASAPRRTNGNRSSATKRTSRPKR